MSKAVVPYEGRSPSVQDLLRFLFDGLEIRVRDLDGNPWFVAKDVCKALGLKDALLRRLAEKDRSTVQIADRLGRMQPTTIISLGGVFALVLTSRVEGADRFRDWLTGEVLPAIYRRGSFGAEKELAALRAENARLASDLASVRALLPAPPEPKPRFGYTADEIIYDDGVTHCHFAMSGVYEWMADVDRTPPGTEVDPDMVWIPGIAIHGTRAHPGPGAYAWSSHEWVHVAVSVDLWRARASKDEAERDEANAIIDRIVRHYDRCAPILRWIEKERRKIGGKGPLPEKVQREAYRRAFGPKPKALAA